MASPASVQRSLSWWDDISWLMNYDAFEETENVGFSAIGYITVANVLIMSMFFSYFTYKRWYDPAYFVTKFGEKPPTLPGPQQGPFAYFRELYRIPEDVFLQYAGFDALIYIRFYLLALKICGSFAIYAWGVLLPINVTGTESEVSAISSFNLLSMSNIATGSPTLWAHTVGLYLLTALAFFFLNGEFKTYTRLRHQYLKLRAPHMRTILLDELPEDMRSNAKLFVYFNTLYPNSVLAVRCTQDLRLLKSLQDEREGVLARLERAIVLKNRGKHQFVWTGPSPCSGQRVPAVDYYTQELQRLNAEVAKEQAHRMLHVRQMDKNLLKSDDQEIHSLKLGDLLDERDQGPIESYLQEILDAQAAGPTEAVTPEARAEESTRRELQELWGHTTQKMDAVGRTLQRLGSHLTSSSVFHKDRDKAQTLLPEALTLEPDYPDMAPKAFVTFKTFSAATIARQVHHASKPGRLKFVEAPEPQDIYWQNTYVTKSARLGRRVLVESLLASLFVFYVVPVTLLYLVFSEDSLRDRFSWIDKLCDKYSLFEAMIELIQPILLLGLMSLLPPLIRVMGMAEGISAESWNQQLALSRYFYFQVINVFLVTTLVGSLFETLSQIVERPSEAFTLLGESLPKVGGFFTEYMIIKACCGLWLELARVFSVVQDWILSIIQPKITPRDKRAVVMGLRPYRDAGWFNFPKYYAQDLLIVVVTFTYACVNPFVLLPALVYFAFAHLVYKNQMLFVYDPVYETGGAFFPKTFRRFIFAIFAAQATMVGILLLKGGYWQTAMVGVLMIITWVFKGKQRGSYEPVALTLPLEIATSLDLDQGHASDEESSQKDAYLQPELKMPYTVSPEVEDDNIELAPVGSNSRVHTHEGGEYRQL